MIIFVRRKFTGRPEIRSSEVSAGLLMSKLAGVFMTILSID